MLHVACWLRRGPMLIAKENVGGFNVQVDYIQTVQMAKCTWQLANDSSLQAF